MVLGGTHAPPDCVCSSPPHMQSFADALIDIIDDAREEGAEQRNVAKILETANKVHHARRQPGCQLADHAHTPAWDEAAIMPIAGAQAGWRH